LVLAVVFVTAGVGKLLDLAGSRQAVRDFGLPDRAAAVAGTLLPIAELATGVALIFVPSARWGALAALVLLIGFIAGIVRAMSRGEEPDCHCFGQIHSAPAGRWTLLRNAVFAALALVILSYGSGPAVDTWVGARSAAELVAIGIGMFAVAAVGYAVTLRAEVERLKNDLVVARSGAALGRRGLAVGADAPPFALNDLQGETVSLTALRERGRPVLLMFMSPTCAPCHALFPTIQQWQQSLSERLTVAVISRGTVEDNEVFNEHGLENVLLQDAMEVAALYGVDFTPSGLFVTPGGKVASPPGEGQQGIEPLVRLALRDAGGFAMESSVA
jgi:methylamine dehydrogenase accessory protein MauD